MIVWTLAVLGVFYECVLYFCICTCSAQFSMFHVERRSRHTLIVVIITLIGAWGQRVSARTSWYGVSIQWLGEIASYLHLLISVWQYV